MHLRADPASALVRRHPQGGAQLISDEFDAVTAPELRNGLFSASYRLAAASPVIKNLDLHE
jgi:hypothetical protein